MKHKAIRVDNLMYKGCEPHWGCVNCGECVPFHCYNKQSFEAKDCREEYLKGNGFQNINIITNKKLLEILKKKGVHK